MKKIMVTASLFVVALAGCSSGMSSTDRDGIIGACAPVYELDWKNVTGDAMPQLANQFVTIRNSAVSLGEEARGEVEKIADLVKQMDTAYDEIRSYVMAEVNFSDTDEENERHLIRDKEFQAEREEISSQISEVCSPYFE